MQSKNRQDRRSNKYMFGFLIPKSYKEALDFHNENNNTRWADVIRGEMNYVKEQEVFTTCQRAKWDSNHKGILNSPPNHQKIRVNLIFAVNSKLEIQGKSFGRWFYHSRPHGEHLFRNCVPEAPKTCHIPWGAQELRTMGS